MDAEVLSKESMVIKAFLDTMQNIVMYTLKSLKFLKQKKEAIP